MAMDRYVEQMKPILTQTGFLSLEMGSQQLRDLYRAGSTHFDVNQLSEFGMACFLGWTERVQQNVESGKADLSHTESPYQFGYATLTIMGAQRTVGGPGPKDHFATLSYLISKGLPVDVPDIVGLTALFHLLQHSVSYAAAKAPTRDYVELLLKSGAEVDYRNRYGMTPLFHAIMSNPDVENIDLLMSHGADLDVQDADGSSPRGSYLASGPQVTAVVQKWLRERNGEEEAPRSEKACSGCRTKDVPLKNCAKCQVARYCSRECQRAHWPTHKKTCKSFNAVTSVTLIPQYNSDIRSLVPMSSLFRLQSGTPTSPPPKSHTVASKVPLNTSASSPKPIIIKVQVPLGSSTGDMMVYTKKRDFVCTIRRSDAPGAYDAVSQMVREKGAGGAKAYFAAELRGRDELVVKVAEVLAEQPF